MNWQHLKQAYANLPLNVDFDTIERFPIKLLVRFEKPTFFLHRMPFFSLDDILSFQKVLSGKSIRNDIRLSPKPTKKLIHSMYAMPIEEGHHAQIKIIEVGVLIAYFRENGISKDVLGTFFYHFEALTGLQNVQEIWFVKERWLKVFRIMDMIYPIAGHFACSRIHDYLESLDSDEFLAVTKRVTRNSLERRSNEWHQRFENGTFENNLPESTVFPKIEIEDYFHHDVDRDLKN